MRVLSFIMECFRVLGILIVIVLFGGFGMFFLDAITWGAIWIPVNGVVLLAPIILVNYLLWGQWFARRHHDDLPRRDL
jgi:hypothetical protein